MLILAIQNRNKPWGHRTETESNGNGYGSEEVLSCKMTELPLDLRKGHGTCKIRMPQRAELNELPLDLRKEHGTCESWTSQPVDGGWSAEHDGQSCPGNRYTDAATKCPTQRPQQPWAGQLRQVKCPESALGFSW